MKPDQNFLFNRMNPPPNLKSRPDLQVLLDKYPQIPCEEEFIKTCLKQSIPQVFSVIAISVDHFILKKADKKNLALLIEIAKIIDLACRKKKKYPLRGIWGLLSPDIFGCYFPERPLDISLQTGNLIRQKLTEKQSDISVTIGAASYPMQNFKPPAIFKNAMKALEHTFFSGSSTTQVCNEVSLNISGDQLYDAGNFSAAIQEFKAALEIAPDNLNIKNSLGVCYGVSADYERALEIFASILTKNPDESMALYNTGLVHLLLQRQQRALEYFLKAEHISDDIFEIIYQIGRLYLKWGPYEQAGPYLEKAVHLNPNCGAAFRWWGEFLVLEGKNKNAVKAYKQAIHLSPFDAEAISALGHLFNIMDEGSEIAALLCRHSVEIDPDKGLFRYRLAECYLKENRMGAALKEFTRAHQSGYACADRIEMIQGRKAS